MYYSLTYYSLTYYSILLTTVSYFFIFTNSANLNILISLYIKYYLLCYLDLLSKYTIEDQILYHVSYTNYINNQFFYNRLLSICTLAMATLRNTVPSFSCILNDNVSMILYCLYMYCLYIGRNKIFS